MLKEKILKLLFDERVTQSEISRRLKASRSRVSEVLKELETKEFIRRTQISQRTVLVSINEDKTLRLGILKSSEYAVVLLALNKLNGVIPFRVKVYDTSLDALKDLMTGSADLVASPLISGYFFHLINRDIRPLAGIAYGGSGIVRRGNGGRIGTTPLSKMDEESRKSGRYSQVYYKKIEDMMDAFRDEEIDAAQLWEPYLTLLNGERNRSKSMCCALFAARSPSNAIRKFLDQYLKDLKKSFTKIDKRNASEMLSEILMLDEELILKSLDSYKFSPIIRREDLKYQIRSFGLPVGREMEDFLEGCSEVSV